MTTGLLLASGDGVRYLRNIMSTAVCPPHIMVSNLRSSSVTLMMCFPRDTRTAVQNSWCCCDAVQFSCCQARMMSVCSSRSCSRIVVANRCGMWEHLGGRLTNQIGLRGSSDAPGQRMGPPHQIAITPKGNGIVCKNQQCKVLWPGLQWIDFGVPG